MILSFTKISKYIFGDKYDYQQDRKNIDTDLLNAQIVINQLAKTVDNLKLQVVTPGDTSITPNSTTYDIISQENTTALGTLTINADTGSPANGQRLLFRLTCTNVQTLAFNALYQAISAMTLPSATTGGGTTDVIEFLWNTSANKWQMILKTI